MKAAARSHPKLPLMLLLICSGVLFRTRSLGGVKYEMGRARAKANRNWGVRVRGARPGSNGGRGFRAAKGQGSDKAALTSSNNARVRLTDERQGEDSDHISSDEAITGEQQLCQRNCDNDGSYADNAPRTQPNHRRNAEDAAHKQPPDDAEAQQVVGQQQSNERSESPISDQKRKGRRNNDNDQPSSDDGPRTPLRDKRAERWNKNHPPGDVSYEGHPPTDNASSEGNNDHSGTRKRDEHFHYHDYAVFIVHYHKTGYVLSRELKNLVRQIEVTATRPNETKELINPVKFQTSGYDAEKNERFAFSHVGNWARSAFPARRHLPDVPCPKRFGLKKGSIYVAESPDLFCSEDDIMKAMSSAKGGTKIIHFVRGSYDMALSNYLYHSQDPTPEAWVHDDDPCEFMYDDDASLSSHVVPTLARWANGTAGAAGVTQQHMDDIVAMCKSIYRQGRKLKHASFYEHLRQLSKRDGLRLATAQMTVASGFANKHLAGGDILRMANNVVKFEELRKDPNVQLLTVSMDDFIQNTTKGTLQFLDFVFGPDNPVITDEMQLEAAVHQTERYERKKQNSKHVTQNGKDEKAKEALRQMLRTDEHLGPVLNLTEMLVNDALSMSR